MLLQQKIRIIMGNQCPECTTPIGECRMRDVFKEQPKQRDDLDLSHIKKGDYKKKAQPKDVQNESLSLGLNFGESVIIQQPKKTKKSPPKKEDLNISTGERVRKPLTIDSTIQTLQLKKGVRYTGGTVERQPHERGKVTWDDGTTLTGQFFLGQLADNQKVYFTFPDGSSYEGQVLDGAANGQGKLTLADGSSIEGSWKNDQAHGFCKHRMGNNTFYEGSFVKGAKAGKGKFYFEEGMYEGLFQNDQFHGEGILMLNDGRNVRGTWRRGVLQGKAEMEWQTGQRYSGEFANGVREGEGTYFFSDGREWSGQWQQDRQNGFGSYQVRGEIIKSVWRAGVKKDEIREIDLSRA